MSKSELLSVYNRVSKIAHKTPVLTSRLLNEKSHAHLFLKCENFQKTGSYKIRGASNAILQLSDEDKSKGVVTHSSGNFAQAISLAAKELGVPAHIVMPSSAPIIKQTAVKDYGGNITICKPTLKDREEASKKIEEKTEATFVHPSNNIDVIFGQGTASYELLEEIPDLDFIICPVGGGGLIAGTCLFTSTFSSKTKIIGAEPLNADDAYRSLQSGKIEENETTETIADGLRTNLGNHNFPIIKEHVSQIIRVTEEEIKTAMRFVWERMKITIEPSSAVSVAAALKEKELFKNKRVGIIISGGNVDLSKLPF